MVRAINLRRPYHHLNEEKRSEKGRTEWVKKAICFKQRKAPIFLQNELFQKSNFRKNLFKTHVCSFCYFSFEDSHHQKTR
jgi:hypothetical protein